MHSVADVPLAIRTRLPRRLATAGIPSTGNARIEIVSSTSRVVDTLGGEAEMTRETAGWHMSRASALDVAVELTDVLTAQLLAQRGSNARAEILDLRMTLKSADPDDPGAVAELTEKLASRIANLTP